MKKIIIPLVLLLAGCRTQQAIETQRIQHDTVTVEHTSLLQATVHDTVAATRIAQAEIEQVVCDTAGRTRTITRIVYRTRDERGTASTLSLSQLDTTSVKTSSSHTHNQATATGKENSRWCRHILFLPAIILLLIALGTLRRA